MQTAWLTYHSLMACLFFQACYVWFGELQLNGKLFQRWSLTRIVRSLGKRKRKNCLVAQLWPLFSYIRIGIRVGKRGKSECGMLCFYHRFGTTFLKFFNTQIQSHWSFNTFLTIKKYSTALCFITQFVLNCKFLISPIYRFVRYLFSFLWINHSILILSYFSILQAR